MSDYYYSETLADAPADARQREREAIQRSIDLLRNAREKGANSREAIDALYYLDRLWSLLLDDLASSDNRLPKELRASLISIGIWILRQVENIRNDRSDDFDGLIDVSKTICMGLKENNS
jgi:flagellar biosynthesis activator protein FlaF